MTRPSIAFTERVRRALARRVLRFLELPPPVDRRLDELVRVGRHSYPQRLPVHHFNTYSAGVSVGAFCSIADDVCFLLDGEHHTDWVTTFPIRLRMRLPGAGRDGQPFARGDIVVGNDVWIGLGATIRSGVTIGDGAVVGARSVVSHNVPAYGVVAGNPAALVRTRFGDDQIAALLRIRWWEWPDNVIAERASLICSADVDGFIERFDPGP